MRPVGTNGKQMSDRAWKNLNDFVARMSIEVAVKKAKAKGA